MNRATALARKGNDLLKLALFLTVPQTLTVEKSEVPEYWGTMANIPGTLVSIGLCRCLVDGKNLTHRSTLRLIIQLDLLTPGLHPRFAV